MLSLWNEACVFSGRVRFTGLVLLWNERAGTKQPSRPQWEPLGGHWLSLLVYSDPGECFHRALSVFLPQIMPSSGSWLLVPGKKYLRWRNKFSQHQHKAPKGSSRLSGHVFTALGWIFLGQVISWVVVGRNCGVFQISLFLHLFPLTWKKPLCSVQAFLNSAHLVLFIHMSSFRQQKDQCTEKPFRLCSWNSCPLEVSLMSKGHSLLHVLFPLTLLWVSQSPEFWPVINSQVVVQ